MELIRSNLRWRRAIATLVLGSGSLLLPGIPASAADGTPPSQRRRDHDRARLAGERRQR